MEVIVSSTHTRIIGNGTFYKIDLHSGQTLIVEGEIELYESLIIPTNSTLVISEGSKLKVEKIPVKNQAGLHCESEQITGQVIIQKKKC